MKKLILYLFILIFSISTFKYFLSESDNKTVTCSNFFEFIEDLGNKTYTVNIPSISNNNIDDPLLKLLIKIANGIITVIQYVVNLMFILINMIVSFVQFIFYY